MLGAVIGTACLLGWIAVRRRSRWGGGGGCGSEGPRSWRRSWGPRGMFFALVDHLGATREQAKVMRDAADDVRDAMAKHRGEARKSREDVAAVLRVESFDAERLGQMFARHDAVLEELRRELVGGLGKVHAVLDERQRVRLAELLEGGMFGGRWARCGGC